jgi:hypothetical protein
MNSSCTRTGKSRRRSYRHDPHAVGQTGANALFVDERCMLNGAHACPARDPSVHRNKMSTRACVFQQPAFAARQMAAAPWACAMTGTRRLHEESIDGGSNTAAKQHTPAGFLDTSRHLTLAHVRVLRAVHKQLRQHTHIYIHTHLTCPGRLTP